MSSGVSWLRSERVMERTPPSPRCPVACGSARPRDRTPPPEPRAKLCHPSVVPFILVLPSSPSPFLGKFF